MSDTSIPVPAGSADLPSILLDRATFTRRLAFVMLVRVLVFTFMLGGTVVTFLFVGTPERLGGTYVTFLFIFIAGLYLLNIVYAALMRIMKRLGELAAIQLGVDMVIAAVLVNFTGGADSAFTLLFMLSPLGAALTLGRRAAVISAAVATGALVLVLIMGYTGMLPTLPGQLRLPWDVSQDSIVSAVLINSSAMFAVALLAGYLSEQVRAAQLTMRQQKAAIYDLTSLNEDIIRCLTSGLITVDHEGEVLTINRHAQEILAMEDAPPKGLTLEALAPAMAKVVLRDGVPLRTELEITRRGEARRIGVSVSPLTDHQNRLQGRIINFQDLTGWHRMEQRVKRHEHLAALGRITAGIAHEIRNPLGAITASLEMVHAGSDLPDEDGKLMGIALREIDRLDGLISDLLTYARPRPWDPRIIDMGRDLEGLAEGIQGLAAGQEGLSFELSVEKPAERYWIRADIEKLRSVLWNLVDNAREAGEHERLCLRLSRTDSGRVVLEVSDRGAGIPEEEQRHIFEPFYTTKEAGTGLGLATVYQIIQEHEANIEVESAEGEGTTFVISFPSQPAPE